MPTARILLALLFAIYVSTADAQTVIVPETTYSPPPTSLVPNSTAMLDDDSVFMAFTDHTTFFGAARFQVVNINTGAIELAPVPLPDAMRLASVAVLGPESALIVVRDDHDWVSTGKYFVVNPLTGAIVRGPIPFTSHGTGWEYRIAVLDPSTVLIAHRSDAGLAGVFTVIDPQRATVKVRETPFAPGGIDTVDVAALDGQRVALAYTGTTPRFEMFFTVIDAHSGAILRPPQLIAPQAHIFALLRRSVDDVVVVYFDSPADAGEFLTLDTVTGLRSAPTTFATGGMYAPGATLIDADTLLVAFSRSVLGEVPAEYVVHDVEGPRLLAAMPFNDGPTYFVSALSSGCRVLLSYQDVPDGQKGKLQVRDFAGVCTPPCPPDITGQLDLFQSVYVPFYTPYLQLQLVLIRNRTTAPIVGPFSVLLEDLKNGALVGGGVTSCASAGLAPFVRLGAGADDVLSPGEVGGAFLVFVSQGAGPVDYRPRVLNGVPRR
jgi:hypothetical protein